MREKIWLYVLVVLMLSTSCVKKECFIGEYDRQTQLREDGKTYSADDYNSISDLMIYVRYNLTHHPINDVSGDTVKVWGYRWNVYDSDIEGDSLWHIKIVSTQDSRNLIDNNEYKTLPITLHNAAIDTVLAHPMDKLYVTGILSATADLPYCESPNNVSIGMNIDAIEVKTTENI